MTFDHSMERFAIIQHRDPAPTPIEVWGERLLGVLSTLKQHADVERVLHWESRQEVYEIPVERDAVTEYLRSRPVSVDDSGIPHPEAGIVTTLSGVARGDRDDDSLCEILLSTGELGPVPNRCRITFWHPLSPERMPALFAGCIAAFSPSWAALESRTNLDERLDEEEEIVGPKVMADARLHWHTYFEPDRIARLGLDSLRGRKDVIVRPLHEGVEVILGERWESNDALRAKQRELEPLLFGTGTPS
jgi:hypothetical protein